MEGLQNKCLVQGDLVEVGVTSSNDNHPHTAKSSCMLRRLEFKEQRHVFAPPQWRYPRSLEI